MFTKADVMRLSGLGEAVVDRLILFDILDPVEARYCFKDIASAREVARLLQNGATEESIIAAGARLRDRGLRVSEARLQGAPWGGLLLGLDAQVTTLDGQFALDLGDVAPQADELHARARVHEDAGECREAERLYRILCRIDRADPTYPFDLGNVLLNQKLYDAAILAFIEAFQRDPTSADPVYNIARIKAERGETQAAVDSYREALKIEPGHAFARFNLALLLTNARRFAEALPLWTAIVQSEADDKALARKAALLCRLEMRTKA
jgi:tetratricopeptide (TPR) repeat protein